MTSHILSSIEYYLVKQPTIDNFSWNSSKTPFSSPEFLVFVIFSYLSFTFTLSHLSLPPIPPSILRPISALHSAFLLLLSLIMALGCALSTISRAPHLHWIICFPLHTPPSGPIFFWAYVFYLSKILEFVDTLLIILGNSVQRLTFLHVYHHSAVVLMCYISLQTSQSLFPMVLLTNASVHVLMYAYYLTCALGVRPTWKRLVTDCQILQFYASFVFLGLLLYFHVSGSGCSGMWGWCFNAVFYASLLALFVDFHKKNYGPGPKPNNSSKKMQMKLLGCFNNINGGSNNNNNNNVKSVKTSMV